MPRHSAISQFRSRVLNVLRYRIDHPYQHSWLVPPIWHIPVEGDGSTDENHTGGRWKMFQSSRDVAMHGGDRHEGGGLWDWNHGLGLLIFIAELAVAVPLSRFENVRLLASTCVSHARFDGSVSTCPPEVVKDLIAAGVYVNYRPSHSDFSTNTILEHAMQRSTPETLLDLVKVGAIWTRECAKSFLSHSDLMHDDDLLSLLEAVTNHNPKGDDKAHLVGLALTTDQSALTKQSLTP